MGLRPGQYERCGGLVLYASLLFRGWGSGGRETGDKGAEMVPSRKVGSVLASCIYTVRHSATNSGCSSYCFQRSLIQYSQSAVESLFAERPVIAVPARMLSICCDG